MHIQKIIKFTAIALAAILVSGFVHPSESYARAPLQFEDELHAFDSRQAVEFDKAAEETGFVTSSHLVQYPGALWLRIHFGEFDLGAKSYITVTSLLDGAVQRLDTVGMDLYGQSSAFFNGDAVEIVLHIAPEEVGIYYSISSVSVGEHMVETESQCGTYDNRVLSYDHRNGRIEPVGCTGWLVSNGAFLTAGHCGGATQMQLIEFMVPLSNADRSVNHPAPEHQFPIIASSINAHDDGSGAEGNDWSVFRVSPNGDGVTPRQKYNAGFFRMTNDRTPTTVRVTGYGRDDDDNTYNYVQQTHSGSFTGEVIQSSSDVLIRYVVDTEGGNSGSAVIDQGIGSNNVAIGIHTNGGCATSGYNTGTGFENNDLENAISDAPVGSNEVYVDIGHINSTHSGTIFRPYDAVGQAVSSVVSGGVVSIVSGSYPRSNANNIFTAGADGKSMMLEAPVGTVTIGF